MSSENVLARIDRCLEEGAEEFLVKPVKLSDVERLRDFILRGDDKNETKVTRKRKTWDDSRLSSLNCDHALPSPVSVSSATHRSLTKRPRLVATSD